MDTCGGHVRDKVFSRTRAQRLHTRVTRTRSSCLLEFIPRYEKVLNFD